VPATYIERYLPVLERETQRLENTIEDLLKLSRLDQGHATIERKRIDLYTLLQNIVTDRQLMAAQKSISLKFETGKPLGIVYGDTGLIEQVISILMSNALNYVPVGGEVVVRTLPQDDYVGFQVSDAGPGIRLCEQRRIFDRFYRGEAGHHPANTGTGLGLSIAKEIMSLHGGEIVVDSQPGEGATFTVWLPANDEQR